MYSVWKYELDVADVQYLDLPKGAQLLSVQMQNGAPCLWALVRVDEPREKRVIRTFGTGHSIEKADELRFVSTYQMRGGALVFHVFEQTGAAS